jgi:hypothetical protein
MRLTERSKDALRLAESESEAMGHDHVGTRHLLLGLLAGQGGIAASVLRSFGLEVDDVRERARTLRSAHEEPNPGASGPSPITRPAVLALMSYGLQEALILGEELADTEHVLLGLIRVAHTHHDCGFARIVGFYDRVRIRNEILRLVARPPDPAEVARRKAKASPPAGEFEAYAVKVLCGALENMPAGDASAIDHVKMTVRFDQQDPAQPVIEVEWKGADDGERAQSLDAHTVRIPPSRAGAQRGMDLRRRWVEEVSRSTQRVGGVDLTGREGDIERAVMALAHRLNRHLHDSDVLWDVIGHSIAAVFPAPLHRDAETGGAK